MDHPRVCGEQSHIPHGYIHCGGSPPRVRGTDGVPNHYHAMTGITPACAGNSQLLQGSHLQGRDHPRVCGEQPGMHRRAAAAPGSPPRVRGTVLL